MARGGVFVFLVCCALASYAAGQGSDSDQCLVYQQGYPAYYMCIIKCFQFVMGFNDSTASLCTSKFKLTKASQSTYTNGHVVNTLKCVAIKCRKFVPDGVCEDSLPGLESSTDFSDFTTAFSTTPFDDDTISGSSTSAPPSSGTTVGDSTSPGLLSKPGSSVNIPPSFTNAGTISSSLSADISMASTTPSPPEDDASQLLLNIGKEQPSDSDECDDEDGDGKDDDSSLDATSTVASITDINPYYSDEGCDNDNSPSPGDRSLASTESDSSSGDDSSASAVSASSGRESSSGNNTLAKNNRDDSAANAASTSSGGDSSSTSAAPDNNEEDGASESSSGGDDSSASAASDLDFFYYFEYDDDDGESNSTSYSNSSDASVINQISSTSVQPLQSTPQPSVGTTSTDSAEGYFSESPDDTFNGGMPINDQTSDNGFDSRNKNYDYAGADAGAGQDGSGTYAFSDSRVGNNNPQIPQNPNWARFGSNPQQAPAYFSPQAPAFNPQQAPAFNPQQVAPYYPQQAPVYNSQQATAYNPQQMPKWNNNNHNNFANNWNYAQQNPRRQNPIRNNWNRRQQGLFPANNQGYQWNQGNINNNGWQGNAPNVPPANNGGFWGNRRILANNVDN